MVFLYGHIVDKIRMSHFEIVVLNLLMFDRTGSVRNDCSHVFPLFVPLDVQPLLIVMMSSVSDICFLCWRFFVVPSIN